MINSQQLERWAADYLDGNLLDNFRPIKAHFDEQIQVLGSEDVAYQLDPPFAGSLKDIKAETEINSNTGVCRILLGYKWVVETQNFKKFAYDMSIVINNVITSFVNKMGNLQDRELRVMLFGNEYFHHMQNNAAFEIRFVLAPKPVVIKDVV